MTALVAVHCGGAPTPSGPGFRGATTPAAPDASAKTAASTPTKLFAFAGEDAPTDFHRSPQGHFVVHTARHLVDIDPERMDTSRVVELPEGTRDIVATGGAPRLLAVGRDVVYVLDGATLGVVARVAMPGLANEEGSVTLASGSGAWAARQCANEGAESGCRLVAFDPGGARRATVQVGDALPLLSPDGAYLVEVGLKKRNVYDASTGRLLLRREGGRFLKDPPGQPQGQGQEPGREETFRFLADGVGSGGGFGRLVISRDGVVEVDDLRSGRVLGSVRYARIFQNSAHLVSPDGSLVASVLPGRQIGFFDTRTLRPRKSASLAPAFLDECNGCSLVWRDEAHVEVLDGEEHVIVSVDGNLERRKADAPERVLSGPAFSVEGDGSERAQLAGGAAKVAPCVLTLAGGPPIPVSTASCWRGALPHFEREGRFVAGMVPSDANRVRRTFTLYDDRRSSAVASLGQRDIVPRSPRDFGGLAGLTGADADPIWLTQAPVDAAMLPSPTWTPSTDDLRAPNTVQTRLTGTHSFRLEWEPDGLTLTISPRIPGAKAFVGRDTSFPPARWYVSAGAALLAVSSTGNPGRPNFALLCDAGSGCKRLPIPGVVGFAWPWILARSAASQPSVAYTLHHAVSGASRALPSGCATGWLLDAAPTVACMSHASSPADLDRIAFLDGAGRATGEVPLPESGPYLTRMEWPGIVLGNRGILLLPRSDRLETWAFDAHRRRAIIVPGLRVALALYPEGRFEVFGDDTPSTRPEGVSLAESTLRCREGETLFPLARCRARAEARGAWDRGDW